VISRLSTERHVERQIRGRRLSSPRPAVYRPTGCTDNPVQLIGDWQIPGGCELLRKYNVQQLEVSTKSKQTDSLEYCNLVGDFQIKSNQILFAAQYIMISSRTLQFHCNVRLLFRYGVVCLSVTRVYCDRTTEVSPCNLRA